MATKPIANFKCASVNSEFGKGPFSFETGSVLAVDRPQVVFIDRDVFRPVTSIFALVKDDNLSGFDWRLDTSGDKVLIKVSGELKEKIDAARNVTSNKAVLLNSIYFAAVMQCLSRLKHGGDMVEETRWGKVILEKCHNAGIDLIDHEECDAAQTLMRSPFKLITTHVFKGDEA